MFVCRIHLSILQISTHLTELIPNVIMFVADLVKSDRKLCQYLNGVRSGFFLPPHHDTHPFLDSMHLFSSFSDIVLLIRIVYQLNLVSKSMQNQKYKTHIRQHTNEQFRQYQSLSMFQVGGTMEHGPQYVSPQVAQLHTKPLPKGNHPGCKTYGSQVVLSSSSLNCTT